MSDSSQDHNRAAMRQAWDWSDLWKKEDYWAIWLAFGLLGLGLVLYFFGSLSIQETNAKIRELNDRLRAASDRAPFKTLDWHEALEAKRKLKATGTPLGKRIQAFTATPQSWKGNPFCAFVQRPKTVSQADRDAYDQAQAEVERTYQSAQSAEQLATEMEFQDQTHNASSVEAIDAWRSAQSLEAKAKKKVSPSSYNRVPGLIGLAGMLAVFFGFGRHYMGTSLRRFLPGFFFVFLIGVLAYTIGANSMMKERGIGYAAWAILLGLLISNTLGTPRWARPAVATEYYIKTGLVLLGAEILFGKILLIAPPGYGWPGSSRRWF